MSTARDSLERGMVVTPQDTTVRVLLELARRKPSRIFAWVVVPMLPDRYAVTRMNELAEIAEDLGPAILDMPLEAVPGLLRPAGSVQADVPQEEARDVALASPGERVAVLEGNEVLGVLNLGPRQPSLPDLDPWRLGGGAPYQWPRDRLPLSEDYVALDGQSPVEELAQSLERSEKGWIFLVIPQDAGTYSVMQVTDDILEDLDEGLPRLRDRPVEDLRLPDPVPPIEEGSVAWRMAMERVMDTPERCLPVTRGGRLVGILAEPERGGRRPAARPPRMDGADSGAGAGGEAVGAEIGGGEGGAEDVQLDFEVGAYDGSPETAQAHRFFNAGFFPETGLDPLPVDRPLALDGGPYRLGVNVGRFWGIGEQPDARFALDGILKDALDGLEQDQSLALVVAVRPWPIGRNVVQIDRPSQELRVPKSADGPLVLFGLTFGRAGRHAINVDLFYQGHLLQSMRVEVWVVRQAGVPLPGDTRAQDRRLTFSRSSTLSRDRLAALDKRPSTLTILVEREGGQTRLWFYDVQGHSLGTEPTPLTDANLHALLGRMRGALQQVENAYAGRIGGDRDKLRLGLWRLATAGFEFYRLLLDESQGMGGALLDLELSPEQVIQVAPLSTLPGVPWELLYDQEIERFREDQPNRVTLCSTFETHAIGACPHQDDPKVVCPLNFWGYRYIIEQLPNWVDPDEQAAPADLPLVVRNSVPLRFVPLVYGWDNLASHLAALRALAEEKDLALEPEVKDLDSVEKVLKEQLSPADILYFYAHGGFDAHEPMLQLGLEGAEFTLTAGDLAAWRDKIDLSVRQPLVVFNACETAAYLPEHHESLPKAFADRGAAGVIGTQVQDRKSVG